MNKFLSFYKTLKITQSWKWSFSTSYGYSQLKYHFLCEFLSTSFLYIPQILETYPFPISVNISTTFLAKYKAVKVSGLRRVSAKSKSVPGIPGVKAQYQHCLSIWFYVLIKSKHSYSKPNRTIKPTQQTLAYLIVWKNS